MHVSVTRVKTSERPGADATIVGEEMVRWLRELEGFRGMMVLSREGSALGLTFWDSRESAERHRASRMRFLDRISTTAGIAREETLDYELSFAELGPLSGAPPE